MTTTYPATKQAFTNPAGTQTLNSPDHAGLHSDKNDTIEAIEDTVGTTAGTNVLMHFAAGNFPVRITGVAATGTVQQTLVGGTHNKFTAGSIGATGGTFNSFVFGTPAGTGGNWSNATFGTPAITGGTMNNGLFGTPTITLASDATGDTFFRSAGGTVNRLGIGTVGQVMTVSSGTLPSWAAVSASVKYAGTSVSGTVSGTSGAMAALTNCLGTIVNTAGNRIMGIWTGKIGASSADKRIAAAFTLNGTQQTIYYMDNPVVDTNANSMCMELHFVSGTLSTTSGTVGINWGYPDEVGTGYIGNNQLTIMELAA